MVKITFVEPDSAAERVGILAGDELTAINGHEICDVLDYRFRIYDRRLKLEIMRGGKRIVFRIRKDEEEDPGLEFGSALMDEKHSCRNACIFCFIDQNPPGMRPTCYFKDDDSRLSFLQGSYITLTNLSEHEIDRIIEMHISPINVSVHTTNPELRCRMMHNRFAGKTLSYLDRFAAAGIVLHAQIVLCRGINDGAELERTLSDLDRLRPALEAVTIVPAGITKYREGLFPLTLFSAEECRAVIEQVTRWSDKFYAECGSRIVRCSDEFYVRGGVPLPDPDFYEGYGQIEDGVGMLTSFGEEAESELKFTDPAPADLPERVVSVATGYAAYDIICEYARRAEAARGNLRVNVYRIRNDFFGETITVAGLLTGRDIAAQLAGQELGETLFFPANALRADGDLFLCGMTPAELSEKLGVPAVPIKNDGAEFIAALTGEGPP